MTSDCLSCLLERLMSGGKTFRSINAEEGDVGTDGAFWGGVLACAEKTRVIATIKPEKKRQRTAAVQDASRVMQLWLARERPGVRQSSAAVGSLTRRVLKLGLRTS